MLARIVHVLDADGPMCMFVFMHIGMYVCVCVRLRMCGMYLLVCVRASMYAVCAEIMRVMPT